MTESHPIHAPELRPFVTHLRALTPIVYVRTADPDGLLRLLAEYNRKLVHQPVWGFFATTDPSVQWTVVTRHRKAKPMDHPDFLPLSVAMSVVRYKEDPRFEMQAMGIIKVEDAGGIPSLAVPLQALSARRFEDIRWLGHLILVGSLPATEAVPSLREIIYPVDLIDGCKSEGTTAQEHKNPASLERLREIFVLSASFLKVKGYEESLAYKGLEGLGEWDVDRVLSLSIIKHRKDKGEDGLYTAEQVLDPEVIDAYRNRWARVA